MILPKFLNERASLDTKVVALMNSVTREEDVRKLLERNRHLEGLNEVLRLAIGHYKELHGLLPEKYSWKNLKIQAKAKQKMREGDVVTH